MAAFLDIDLEQVAHVVERRRCLAEVPLLLDRRGLGVALDHDQASQHGAMLAGTSCQAGSPTCVPNRHRPVLFLRRKQDAPAIFRHADVIEFRPAARIDRIGGAQIDQRLLETFRPHVLPPVEIAGMPALQRLEHAAVFGEPDIVRDLGRVVDVDDVHHTLLGSNAAFWPVP